MKRGALLRKPSQQARLEVPVFKPRPCKVCKERFTPSRPIQPTCSLPCHLTYADKVLATSKAKLAKEEKKQDRARKEKLKTRSDYIKEAQREFNKYIRLRDSGKPCICCGVPLGSESATGGAFDCGHYRSVGSAPHLRFVESNAHGQTKKCNRYGAGRAVDYRRGLIARIGQEAVEALEADQAPRHYSIDDLKAIKTKYRALARQIEKKETTNG